jgi:hypothetical protein
MAFLPALRSVMGPPQESLLFCQGRDGYFGTGDKNPRGQVNSKGIIRGGGNNNK